MHRIGASTSCILLLLQAVSSFTGHNTPPVFDFKREWIIQENEPVGSRVAVARTRDEEGDPIEYGIEPATYVDGSHFFRIGPDTGEVLLARSLQGQGGNDFYLYVTANDGHQTAKIEVYVRVLPSDAAFSPAFEVPFSTSRPSLRPFPPFAHPPRPPDPASAPSDPPPVLSSAAGASPAAQPPAGPPPDPPSPAPPPSRGGGVTGSGLPSSLLPVLALVGLAPFMMLLLWLLHRRCKRTETLVKQLKNASSLAKTTADTFSCSPAALLWSQTQVEPDHWEIPRSRLNCYCKVGEGCFGQVWMGYLRDGEDVKTVAVKALKNNASEKEKKDLLSELEVMKTLDAHPNVVKLIGCCSDKDPVLLILEYCSRGKLQSYLRAERGSAHLTSRQLTLFSHQVAKGMEYLAGRGIIHRDLAARNVLLDDDRVCKVADFGFARDVLGTHLYERKSEGRLPIRWMAPESLVDNVYTTKTDVWSFGVLLWEIVTLGSTPYPGLSGGDVVRRIRDGYRLEKPEHCRREMYNIMARCWEEDPQARPAFGDLVRLLELLLQGDQAYIELERFPDHSYYNIANLPGEKL